MDAKSRISPNFFKKPPDAVLFDWDNTLFNQQRVVHDVAVKALKKLGKEPYPTPDEMIDAWHDDSNLCCQKYFPGHSSDEVVIEWEKLMAEVPPKKLSLNPGTIDVLKNLKDRKIPMLIVSNKPRDHLLRELNILSKSNNFDLAGCFDVIVGGHDDMKKRKPSPLPIIAALDEYNSNKKPDQKKLALGNLWYIGDHHDDAVAARSDGIQRYILGERHRKRAKIGTEDNDPAGGIIYLDNLHQFNDMINKLPPVTQKTIV